MTHRCCHCCASSQDNGRTLWCDMLDGPAVAACAQYVREPGADCEERPIHGMHVRPAALAVQRGAVLHGSHAASDADPDGIVVAGKHDDERERGIAQ